MLATEQKKKQNLMINKEKTTKYQNQQFERPHYNAKEQKIKLEEMEDTRKTITVNSQTIDYLQQLLLQINAVSESLFKPKKVLKSVQTQTDIKLYEPIIKRTSDCSVEPIKINVNNKIKIDNYNAGKFKCQLTKRNHQLKTYIKAFFQVLLFLIDLI